MDNRSLAKKLKDIYRRLLANYGPQHWWPAEEPFEVIVGAILTQSAAWGNVEKAIANLRAADALSPEAIRQLSIPRLAKLVRPCGYYKAKARKLKSFVYWLGNHHNYDLNRLFASDIDNLRQQLLSINGIGQETADSIILYAADKPIFVVDAYTRRIMSRIGLAPAKNSYADYQALFMNNLPPDVQLFNEYHALLVYLGKKVCRPKPLCSQCCLNKICQSAPPS
jgi:endonuclease-3 related protein